MTLTMHHPYDKVGESTTSQMPTLLDNLNLSTPNNLAPRFYVKQAHAKKLRVLNNVKGVNTNYCQEHVSKSLKELFHNNSIVYISFGDANNNPLDKHLGIAFITCETITTYALPMHFGVKDAMLNSWIVQLTSIHMRTPLMVQNLARQHLKC